MKRLLVPLALFLSTCLCACPARRGDDDDDAAKDDDDDVLADDDDDVAADDDDDAVHADSPVITGVAICLEPVTPEWCDPPGLVAEVGITVTDPDCDLNNPSYELILDGGAPSSGVFEGSLDCGGTLNVGLCSQYVSGHTMSVEVTFTDAAGHTSEPWEGTWTVPDEADCGP